VGEVMLDGVDRAANRFARERLLEKSRNACPRTSIAQPLEHQIDVRPI
jgi:hypothetical protein